MGRMRTIDADEWNTRQARGGLYRLLARLWLSEVDPPLWQALHAPPLRDAFVAAGGVLQRLDEQDLRGRAAGHDRPPSGTAPADPSRDAILESLAADYCQLFVGPRAAALPVQSVWNDGRYHGEAVASMRAYIDQGGYPTARLPEGIMLDHLGVQLDVMGHLVQASAERQAEREPIAALPCKFYADHLAWADGMLETAVGRAETAFYRGIVTMTREFLAGEPA